MVVDYFELIPLKDGRTKDESVLELFGFCSRASQERMFKAHFINHSANVNLGSKFVCNGLSFGRLICWSQGPSNHAKRGAKKSHLFSMRFPKLTT
jgi:hypothetical protein